MNRFLLTVTLCAVAAGCNRPETGTPAAGTPATQPATAAVQQPAPPIDSNAILERIKILASDEYEGRAPGTKGEDLTIKYLVDESKKLGLQPGNPDGTYVQKVPLVGITGAQAGALTVSKAGQKRAFKWADEVVAWTRRVADTASIDGSDLVFVGYGVTAPEYD